MNTSKINFVLLINDKVGLQFPLYSRYIAVVKTIGTK